MIKTQAIGHLGQDANLNNVNGKNVINFSLAHTEKFKDAQGVQKEKTIWLNCAYWTDKTGIAPYLKKGTQVYIEGIPEPAVYMDRSNKAQVDFKIRIVQIQLLGGGGNNQNQNQGGGYAQSIGNPQGNYKETVNYSEAPGDDLPF